MSQSRDSAGEEGTAASSTQLFVVGTLTALPAALHTQQRQGSGTPARAKDDKETADQLLAMTIVLRLMLCKFTVSFI